MKDVTRKLLEALSRSRHHDETATLTLMRNKIRAWREAGCPDVEGPIDLGGQAIRLTTSGGDAAIEARVLFVEDWEIQQRCEDTLLTLCIRVDPDWRHEPNAKPEPQDPPPEPLAPDLWDELGRDLDALGLERFRGVLEQAKAALDAQEEGR